MIDDKRNIMNANLPPCSERTKEQKRKEQENLEKALKENLKRRKRKSKSNDSK